MKRALLLLAAVAAMVSGAANAGGPQNVSIPGWNSHYTLRNTTCTSGSDCKTQIDALLTAAAAAGVNTVYTDGLHFKYLASSLELPAGITLDCGGNGAPQTTSTNWATLPSSIEIDPGTAGAPTGFSAISDAGAKFVGCNILNTNIVSLPKSTDQQIMDGRLLFNGTLWQANGKGAGIARGTLMGGNLCINSPSGNASIDVENLYIDCTNGLFIDGMHEVPILHDVFANNWWTKNNSAAETDYTISAITNASGVCGITTSTAHDFKTGYPAYVIGTNGTCDGYHQVTVVDSTHVTLDSSVFAPPAGVTGTGTKGNWFITVSSIANLENGMGLSDGSSCLPANATITTISHADSGNKIVHFAGSAALACSLSSAAITFTNTGGSGTIVLYTHAHRGYAYKITNGEGIGATDLRSYGFNTGFYIGGTQKWFVCTGCSADFLNTLKSQEVKNIYFTDTASANDFIGGVFHAGKMAAVQNSSPGAANELNGGAPGDEDVGGGIADIFSGRFILANTRTTATGGLDIGAGATAVSLTGNLLPNTSVAVESAVPSVVNTGNTFHAHSNVAGSPLFHPGFIAGNYYTQPNSGLSTTALSANTLYFTPFYSAAATTFSKESVDVTGAAGTSCELGLYSDGGGKPNALLYDAGTVSSAGTGEQGLTSKSVPVPAGWSWLAVGCDNTPTLEGTTAGNQFMSFIAGMTNITAPGGKYTAAWTFSAGALPANPSVTLATGATPLVYVRL